ncbi:hypothetical protein G6L37_06045 [Agrobacterium rubi]|nr:hypothetical protein [Agrobacterium rubi]NTF24922.1 hypothetical protein [Agrobacterium rubi]
MDNETLGSLIWSAVDAHHLRAVTDFGFNYEIIHTSDGRVSWQGQEYDEWKFEANVEDAKAAAQAEFDAVRNTVSVAP